MMSSPMPETAFHVRGDYWSKDGPRLRLIRERVFVREPEAPLKLGWDGQDESAVHLIAEDAEGRPTGTARLLPNGQIGRMAVRPIWRERGVGSTALPRELLGLAAQDPDLHPFLTAQTSALGFYQNNGFVVEAEDFVEAGIPHRRMHRPDRS